VHDRVGDELMRQAGIDVERAHARTIERHASAVRENDRMYGVDRGATNVERGGPNAAPAVVALGTSEERAATGVHAVRDGREIALAPGYRQEGRVLSADERSVTVIAGRCRIRSRRSPILAPSSSRPRPIAPVSMRRSNPAITSRSVSARTTSSRCKRSPRVSKSNSSGNNVPGRRSNDSGAEIEAGMIEGEARPRFTAVDVARSLPRQTLTRGLAYAGRGAVSNVVVRDRGCRITATVEGSRSDSHAVTIEIDPSLYRDLRGASREGFRCDWRLPDLRNGPDPRSSR
jgi:hypothetical protein